MRDVGEGEFVASSQDRPWIRVLSKADPERLKDLSSRIALPPVEVLRAPETGMVMVRGRMGGAGRPFNLGEMTVTRCVVRLATGETGAGYVAGRDKTHARLAATVDAMMQSSRHEPDARAQVVEPLAAAQAARREALSRKAHATKVDFFTMVRDRKA